MTKNPTDTITIAYTTEVPAPLLAWARDNYGEPDLTASEFLLMLLDSALENADESAREDGFYAQAEAR